jgi:hypothetical protein
MIIDLKVGDIVKCPLNLNHERFVGKVTKISENFIEIFKEEVQGYSYKNPKELSLVLTKDIPCFTLGGKEVRVVRGEVPQEVPQELYTIPYPIEKELANGKRFGGIPTKCSIYDITCPLFTDNGIKIGDTVYFNKTGTYYKYNVIAISYDYIFYVIEGQVQGQKQFVYCNINDISIVKRKEETSAIKKFLNSIEQPSNDSLSKIYNGNLASTLVQKMIKHHENELDPKLLTRRLLQFPEEHNVYQYMEKFPRLIDIEQLIQKYGIPSKNEWDTFDWDPIPYKVVEFLFNH